MCIMPTCYPQEFRDRVVRVARPGEDGDTLRQIALRLCSRPCM